MFANSANVFRRAAEARRPRRRERAAEALREIALLPLAASGEIITHRPIEPSVREVAPPQYVHDIATRFL